MLKTVPGQVSLTEQQLASQGTRVVPTATETGLGEASQIPGSEGLGTQTRPTSQRQCHEERSCRWFWHSVAQALLLLILHSRLLPPSGSCSGREARGGAGARTMDKRAPASPPSREGPACQLHSAPDTFRPDSGTSLWGSCAPQNTCWGPNPSLSERGCM